MAGLRFIPKSQLKAAKKRLVNINKMQSRGIRTVKLRGSMPTMPGKIKPLVRRGMKIK